MLAIKFKMLLTRLATVLMPEATFATVTDANLDAYFRLLTYRLGFVRLAQTQLGLAANKGLDDFVQMWQNNPVVQSRPAESRQYNALARLLQMNVADLELLVKTCMLKEVSVFLLPQIDDNTGNITASVLLLEFDT
jgi:hypothetical protein